MKSQAWITLWGFEEIVHVIMIGKVINVLERSASTWRWLFDLGWRIIHLLPERR